jgi:hypothetical protein
MKRAPVFLLVLLGAGCLGEPALEDRWTRLDLRDPLPAAPDSTAADTLTVQGRVVFRSVITGAVIAEIRASDTVSYASVNLDPDAERGDLLRDVQAVLDNSTVLASATLPITGWDHLIRDMTLGLSWTRPATPPAGLFLVFYLGTVEEMETPQGGEEIIITPFVFEDVEVLPMGMELGP